MPTDPARWPRIEAVLDEVLDLPSAARREHVAAICRGDDALARDVLALIDADERAHDDFLAPPSGAAIGALLGPDAAATPSAAPGRVVGAYRLTALIGEGGMGAVYDAQRADGQFEQHVAVKLMRWAGATAGAQRRFIRERQILAQLDHPHIARLFDGGVTDDGTPYFVMERVTPGTPITTWCDEHQLGVDARLALVLQACDAVQHAHRQLIVHRDLKPSNIVVDGAGSAKLLDFGIAKLLADDDAPFATLTDARPMTPAFAAPEQVEGASITTATDVYALGVVLYVVLTGRLPYDGQTTRVTDWARAVLETVPLRPSLAVTDPRRVARLRGDLDRIVLKSLEKEPARRYLSMEAFGADIRRFLAGLPVEAHDASRWYRARKFVGRSRLLVGGVAATMVALAVGMSATVWQAQKARAEARRAEAVQGFLVSVFAQADPDQAKGRELTARQILDAGSARIEAEFAAQPQVRTALWGMVHDLSQKLGDYRAGVNAAQRQTEGALAGFGPDSLEYGHALRQLASALLEVEDAEGAAASLAKAVPILQRATGTRSDEMADALNAQGWVAIARGSRDEGIRSIRAAREIARSLHGADSENAAAIENDLVVALGDGDEALALAQHVSAVYGTTHGTESYMYSVALYNEGNQLYSAGRWADAVRTFATLLPLQEKLLGSGHAKTVLTYRQLARLAAARGDFDGARTLMAKAIAGLETEFGAASAAVALARSQLGNIERMSGRYAEGVGLGRRAADALRGTTESPSNLALVLESLAANYLGAGDARAALEASREGVHISEGPDNRWLGANLAQRGAALVSQGQRPAAMPELRRAVERFRASGQGRSTGCASALRWLADAGAGSMSNAERETLYQESLALFAAVAPAEQADALDADVAYATFLTSTARASEAASVVDQVLAAFARSTGLDPARTHAARDLKAALAVAH